MNILELAPAKSKRASSITNAAEVAYSWHNRKEGKAKHGITFRFLPSVLNKARFVDGDRCEIHVNDDITEMTFVIVRDGGNKLSGKGKTRLVQLKYDGVEKLQEIFPIGNMIELKLIEVSSGKITCKLPTTKGTK